VLVLPRLVGEVVFSERAGDQCLRRIRPGGYQEIVDAPQHQLLRELSTRDRSAAGRCADGDPFAAAFMLIRSSPSSRSGRLVESQAGGS
jgi:hypothetical protein